MARLRWRLRYLSLDRHPRTGSEASQLGELRRSARSFPKEVERAGFGQGERRLALVSGQRPCNANLSRFGRETVLTDGRPDLLDGDAVVGPETNGRQALIQAHLHGLYSAQLLHGHAHGVGTYRSVHAEDGLPHFLQLSPGGSWPEQRQHAYDQRGGFHVTLLRTNG